MKASFPSTKLNVTIRPDGITFLLLCLAICPKSAAIISPVNIILFQSRYAPDTFAFHEGIAGANTSNVQYFEGKDRQDKYDDFYTQLVRVKDIAVLTFAKTAQLLVAYTLNKLKQQHASNCYERHCTLVSMDNTA